MTTSEQKHQRIKSRKHMAKSPYLVIQILAAWLQNAAVEENNFDSQFNSSKAIGYDSEELAAIPHPSILGVGCGNPTKFAHIKEGDTVVDLGSGAGIDVFLAANIAKENGKVIGIDMTDKMLEKARHNARKIQLTKT